MILPRECSSSKVSVLRREAAFRAFGLGVYDLEFKPWGLRVQLFGVSALTLGQSEVVRVSREVRGLASF